MTRMGMINLEKMNDFIKVPSSIIRNACISPNAKMIYILLSSNRRVGVAFNTLCVSVSSILHMTKYKYHTKNINIIKSAIGELIECGSITIFKDMALNEEINFNTLKAPDMFFVRFNDDYVNSKDFINTFDVDIDFESLNGELNIFTCIYLDDFVRIIDADFDHYYTGKEKITVNKAKLISVYAMILSRANIDLENLGKGDKISYEQIDTISKYTGVSSSAIRNYIRVLFDMKLIFKITVSKKGQLKSKNVYSRWRDRNCVICILDKNKSIIDFDYHQLLKIGNHSLDEIDATRILMSISTAKINNITNEWVDKEILSQLN